MTSSAQQLLDTTASFLQQTQKPDKIQCGCLKRDTEIIFRAATVRFQRNGQYQYGTDRQQKDFMIRWLT